MNMHGKDNMKFLAHGLVGMKDSRHGLDRYDNHGTWFS